MEMNAGTICRNAAIDQSIDYFSSLPDSIIARIFSFLTMEEALRICVLSNKLRPLWNIIPNLEFKEPLDDSLNLLVDAKKRNLIQVIDKFLEHHDGPIHSFRLSLYPGWCWSDVFHWICQLMKSGVEELDLNFLSNIGMPSHLLSSLSDCGTLKVLKLRSCIIGSPLGFAGFSSLNTLFLGDMSFSDDIIHSILCKCEFVRSLTLQNCWGFEIIKVTDIKARLDSLSLENCPSLENLYVPRLKTLYMCIGKMKVFVIEASQVKSLQVLQKSTWTVIHEGTDIRHIVLDRLSFAAEDEMEEDIHLEYQGIVKFDFETSLCDVKKLHGHAWLLRCTCVEKLVLQVV